VARCTQRTIRADASSSWPGHGVGRPKSPELLTERISEEGRMKISTIPS
jgi:hypothetical protein